MNQTAHSLPDDPLAELLADDAQQDAARNAQDAFARLFRATLEGDAEARRQCVSDTATTLKRWSQGGGAGEAVAALRLALLFNALDQWGLAYSQAFGPVATVALSDVLGVLRNGLTPEEEARCQRFFEAINADEAAAFAYKVELRRGLHLALWHAMIASEQRDEAFNILKHLGSMLIALVKAMPDNGWRLVADALAHVQIRCLGHALAVDGIAQETTQELFASLSRELPKDERDRIMAHATQVVLAWQQARRGAAH